MCFILFPQLSYRSPKDPDLFFLFTVVKPVFEVYRWHSVSARYVNVYSVTETGHARPETVMDLASGTGRGQEIRDVHVRLNFSCRLYKESLSVGLLGGSVG